MYKYLLIYIFQRNNDEFKYFITFNISNHNKYKIIINKTKNIWW